jgi:hypothetical protein
VRGDRGGPANEQVGSDEQPREPGQDQQGARHGARCYGPKTGTNEKSIVSPLLIDITAALNRRG